MSVAKRLKTCHNGELSVDRHDAGRSYAPYPPRVGAFLSSNASAEVLDAPNCQRFTYSGGFGGVVKCSGVERFTMVNSWSQQFVEVYQSYVFALACVLRSVILEFDCSFVMNG